MNPSNEPQRINQTPGRQHKFTFSLAIAWSFALLILPLKGASEIYKHTDQHGNVVFSDSPSIGSSKVELKKLPILNFPAPADASAPQPAPKVFKYTTFEINSPKPDATIRDNNGALNVTTRIDPALKKGHRLQLYVDGSPSHAKAVTSTFKLEQIDRGSHRLQAKVFNKENKLIQSTASITIHLHQFSKLHKN